jgi:microcystin-dependent protein
MSEPFIAEVKIFAGNFAPRGWAFCNGQLLPISQNTALFSLIGTTYGGDGRTTTALPNLQGRAVMHPGRGPGLTSRRLGQTGGTETVTLSEAQMASHTHAAQGSTNPGNQRTPVGNAVATGGGRGVNFYASSTSTPTGTLEKLGNAGASQAHNNMQPFLTLNYIIALVGLYPSRS